MKKRDIIINSSLLLATFALFFGGVEVVLRVTGLQRIGPQPVPVYQKSEDADISYELKPSVSKQVFRSTVTTNSLGMRSPEIDANKPLIAFIGDSITFGYGVENDQTLAAQVQKHLPAYFMLNAGVPGYNLRQERATFVRNVAPLSPKAVVLTFHFNDVEDSKTSYLDDTGILRSPDWKPGMEVCAPITRGLLGYLPGKCWLDTHSAFYKAVKKVVNARYGEKALEQAEDIAKAPTAEDPVTDAQLQNYAQELQRFTSGVPQNMPKLFVIWPDALLHRESKPKLIAIAKQNGFAILDLYETFGNEAKTLGWDTVHPHPETIATAAEKVAEALGPLLP